MPLPFFRSMRLRQEKGDRQQVGAAARAEVALDESSMNCGGSHTPVCVLDATQPEKTRPLLPAHRASLRRHRGEAGWCPPSTPELRRSSVRERPPDLQVPGCGRGAARAARPRVLSESRRQPVPAHRPRQIGAAHSSHGCAAGWVLAISHSPIAGLRSRPEPWRSNASEHVLTQTKRHPRPRRVAQDRRSRRDAY